MTGVSYISNLRRAEPDFCAFKMLFCFLAKMLYLKAPFFRITCSPLKKFTKMRDDAMMICISVKITRIYVNGFNTPKDDCGILIFFILTFDRLFSI